LSVVPGALLDALIATVVFAVIAVILGVKATAMLVLFPVGMLGIMLLAIGAGILVSALTVPYRDVQHILPVMVQLLFWGSPVIVPASLYTGKLVWFMLLNPMSGYLELVRAALLGTPLPSGNLLAISVGTTIVMLITGITVFRSMERTFADII
jgi:lipopolysaccharide transport system permease protein